MNLTRFGRLTAIVLILGMFTTSCFQPNDDRSVDEQDITLTKYETGFDFQQYLTFAVRDSVGIIHNHLSDDEIAKFYKPGGGNDQIRNYVISKYQAEGYTLVEATDNFDFGVNLMIASLETEGVVTYPPYWWWGYGGYWGWYGWYYPPYYPGWGYPGWGYTYYSYQTGSLFIEQSDGDAQREYWKWLEQQDPDEIDNIPPEDIPPMKIRWQAIVNGVASSDASYNKDRAQRGVDEAFEQSPYLKKNGAK